ncbi:hypothetical protein ALC60_13883 [Trachymyrmex zeteki]|uniref:Uncharacterized protein n=1 Tax=Mycetomoellerius zeteki TaxID=64791 RepID=A0A151WH45_9HYME|nr:hypothetical protein ALC60_13883 [Trachymyrmex zeteki]
MSRDGVRVTRICVCFKRPNVFRELKLLTGVRVGVTPLRNCGTLAALMRAFPTLPRIIPAFAARERRSTTCGLPLSAYGTPRQPCVNAIRHPDACVPRNAAVAAVAAVASSSLISRAASISHGGFEEEAWEASGDGGTTMGTCGMGIQVGYLFRGHGRMLMQRRDLWNVPGGSMSGCSGRLAGQSLLFYSRS